jgi:probable F420-dependent oxidoreductase
MELSAFFPTRYIGRDPAKIRDWAQAAEDLGYAHIEVADHVFGARAREGWTPIYNETDPFHETFTTLAFIAAVTKRIKLASGVLILPQRQTGLVAKQAAEVDILSGGRLRLGIGVGWNHVEYESLGVEWKARGARQAEQVQVMRRLWTEDVVTFAGRFHDLREVSILPAPVQRPIPIWFGGSSEAVMKRAAEIGDGWMPIMAPDDKGAASLAALREHLKALGRDPAAFGIEGWLRMSEADPQKWAAAAEAWRRLGAGIALLYPMYRMTSVEAQIETLRRFKEVVPA